MKKNAILLLLLFPCLLLAQELSLVKGGITENIVVNDSLKETMSVYLPSNFEMSKKWPVVFVFDMKGKGKQALSSFKSAADEEGYILATSNNTSDTLSLPKNILISERMLNVAYNLLPLAKARTYTAGFSGSARFASILPNFIKGIQGVISCGAPVGNLEILSAKNSFYFVGIVGREDYNFIDMMETRILLDKLKFQNRLLLFEGGSQWPEKSLLVDALQTLTFSAMAKNNAEIDLEKVNTAYETSLNRANSLFSAKKPLMAEHLLSEMMKDYIPFKALDSLKGIRRQLRRTSAFKSARRNQNSVLLKETFTKEDYVYFLEEDVLTYNYSNLGWWKFQMEELEKLLKSKNIYERQMSRRLRGYINALIEDNIDMVMVDGDGAEMETLNLLYMLKTITEPKNFESYLNIISNTAKIEDYGTALFYLEELLKNGYTNKDQLYAVEHTALFRIMPEFNALVEKYLNSARYDVMEE